MATAVALPDHVNRLLLLGELQEERLRERVSSEPSEVDAATEQTGETAVATVAAQQDSPRAKRRLHRFAAVPGGLRR